MQRLPNINKVSSKYMILLWFGEFSTNSTISFKRWSN